MSRFELRTPNSLLVANCHPAFAEQARVLLDELAKIESRCGAMTDGTTVQFGWSLLRMRAEKDELHVFEPDFEGQPLVDSRDEVTTTVTILAQQRDILVTAGVDGEAAFFAHRIVIAKNVLSEHEVYMERKSRTTSTDTGWYIGPVEGEANGYSSILVHELLRQRPELLRATALPEGYLVVFEGKQLKAIVNPVGEDALKRR